MMKALSDEMKDKKALYPGKDKQLFELIIPQ